jgi:glycine betaine/proline transport system substrate-binding protein
MTRLKKTLLCTLALTLIVTLTFAPSMAKEKITFGYVDWPGVTVKTHVGAKILEYLGYEADLKGLSVPVVFKGLDSKDLDLFLGGWLPTMKSISDKYFEKGSIIELTVNLNETIYTLAVPGYAWRAGCQSHADLHKFGDKFDHRIIGIEPGNDGNKIVLDMIENDTYNLGDWELVEGSTEAMMIAVGSAIKKKEWICWLGWSPHWMNLVYDIKYLKDPQNAWGDEPEVVKTLARSGFDKEYPNLAKLFTQFRVTPQMQGYWIDQYSRKKKEPEKIAEDWIRDNLGIVNQWVYGVTAADGKTRGRDTIRQAISE